MTDVPNYEAVPSARPQERVRPDWSGDERSQLAQVLDYNRMTVRLRGQTTIPTATGRRATRGRWRS